MGFTQKNWEECLLTLGFTEQENPNGGACYDIYDNEGVPRWQYEGLDDKELLYFFFLGVVYGRYTYNGGV